MTYRHWLVKQEPDSYPWEAFVRDGSTSWDGVRNYQARNNLRAMEVGDPVLFYASGEVKAVVGTARVARGGYPDPTADEPGWVSVGLKAEGPLRRPVTLAEIKADPALSGLLLVRNSRLSVVPVGPGEYERIMALSRSGAVAGMVSVARRVLPRGR
jgi:predicted RNA-binding protein with PUA-like domain